MAIFRSHNLVRNSFLKNICELLLATKLLKYDCFSNVVVVVVEILFCIADQTGNGAQYYDGDKVTAESQGYNKQASTKERKTRKTQTAQFVG